MMPVDSINVDILDSVDKSYNVDTFDNRENIKNIVDLQTSI